MVVKVVSKIRHATFRTFVAHNLVGDSMLVRLRSTTIGLLGLVAAVGLGLVVVISQQGWPRVLTGPLPQAPPALVQNDPITMPRLGAHPSAIAAHRRSQPGSPASRAVRHRPAPVVSHEVESAPEPPVAVGEPQAKGHRHRGHASQPQATPSPTVLAQVPSDEPAAESSSAPPDAEPASKSPGHSGEAPGHSGESHGHSGEAPGHSGESPGHAVATPGQASASPGHSGEAPGHAAGGPPGHSGESPGGRH